ncbi:helix-turn-helix transcriptional regulator [Alienimonas sp. DA493]|uniref:helix-turn-helix transcriptional regulator n=1 Tax=Alienimonas sp. DA493 TaxID=3373605 RepID=UPI0037542C8E
MSDSETTGAVPRLLVGRNDIPAVLNVSTKCWDRQCDAGATPAAVRIGGRKLWRVADLEDWVRLGCPDRRTFESHRDAEAAEGSGGRGIKGPVRRRTARR